MPTNNDPPAEPETRAMSVFEFVGQAPIYISTGIPPSEQVDLLERAAAQVRAQNGL